MRELIHSAYFGVLLSLFGYWLGGKCKKYFKLAIFTPILVAIVFAMLVLFVAKIDYQIYYESAKYLSFLLTPATICLAVPLYEQISLLKEHWRAIFLGILSGVITSAVCVLAMSVLFHLDHAMYVTLLPKSITTAIGMDVSKELGGYVTITIAVIIITGVLGNAMAELVCKWFKITDPIAKGIAIGTSAHAMGTAKALELGEVEGAMSSLSIAVGGGLTVLFATLFSYIPL